MCLQYTPLKNDECIENYKKYGETAGKNTMRAVSLSLNEIDLQQ